MIDFVGELVITNAPPDLSLASLPLLFPRVRERYHKKVWDFIGLYQRCYEWISGAHPHRRPWHSLWLPVKDLYRDLREVLPKLEGSVLDVGCMGKPYAEWMPAIREHVGIDVVPGEKVDYVIQDGVRWPLETGSFGSAICTQVLQVVSDTSQLVEELDRVLVPNGTAVIAAPFCYRDMSYTRDGTTYKDYRRYTVNGIEELFSDRFEIVEVRRQGGIGSTVGTMVLTWIQLSLSWHPVTYMLFILLLPLWLLFCLSINAIGWLADKADRTGVFYHNVLFVLRKKADRG